MTLTFSAAVYPCQVADFNRNPTRDVILILHLENSRDFFINVSVNFVPSVFGCSLVDVTLLVEEGPKNENVAAGTTRVRSGALNLDHASLRRHASERMYKEDSVLLPLELASTLVSMPAGNVIVYYRYIGMHVCQRVS